MKARINGFDLAYRLEGPETARVVTFCHSLAADSGMWDEQMAALKDRRVLRLDMRGHGASSAPSGPYTLRQLAGDVVALWDHLGIDRCDFVGLSIGGMTAMRPEAADIAVLPATSYLRATPSAPRSFER